MTVWGIVIRIVLVPVFVPLLVLVMIGEACATALDFVAETLP